MSTPSTPSPAARHFARLCQRSGRGTGGHLVRFWAMSSPPPRHHIASEQQPQGIASTFCHPARLVQFLFHPSGGEGRAASQPGRATPSRSPRLPSPPCRGASAYMRTPPKVGEGVVSTYQGGEGRPCDSKFREILRGCIALNINYLFSPLGYAVQRQYIGEMVIVLKV